MKKLFLLALLSQALFSPGIELQAADSKTAKKPAAKTAKDPNNIAPTHKNVKYGAHQKELVNFWQVESKEPLGLLLDIGRWSRRNHSGCCSTFTVVAGWVAKRRRHSVRTTSIKATM
jgi:hypothetical protein